MLHPCISYTCGVTKLGRMEEPDTGKLRPRKRPQELPVLWQYFYVKICVLEIDCHEPIPRLDLRHNHLDCQHFELVRSEVAVQSAKI